MRRITMLCLSLFVISIATCVWAEDKPTVAWIERITVKPGMEGQFEEALQKHYAWHRQQADKWPQFVWQVVTGEHAGSYLIGTFNHSWKDFDAREEFEKSDMKEAMATLAPLVDSYMPSLWMFMELPSLPIPGETPTKYSQIVHFFLTPSADSRFKEDIMSIGASLKEAGYLGHYNWYHMVSGGESPHYVVAVPLASFAEFAGPEKNMRSTLEEKLGGRRATELFDSLMSGVRSVETELIQFRPELSYIPNK